MKSPYDNKPEETWKSITKDIVAKHPLSLEAIKQIVLESWEDITKSSIGNYKIGVDIFPQPQILGFFLHELIPLKLATRFPGQWHKDKTKNDKDAVYIKDSHFSIEIKTSSNPKKVFGNRSYGKKAKNNVEKTKTKSGYYLLINFKKITNNDRIGGVTKIRFGWIDENDWASQSAETGQQASLSAAVYEKKMIEIQL